MKVVRFCLAEYLDANSISRYNLAKRTGIQYHVIDSYYKNKVCRLDSYNLGRIVYYGRGGRCCASAVWPWKFSFLKVKKPSLGRVAVSLYLDLERYRVSTNVECNRQRQRHGHSPPLQRCSQTAAALPAHLSVSLSEYTTAVNKMGRPGGDGPRIMQLTWLPRQSPEP